MNRGGGGRGALLRKLLESSTTYSNVSSDEVTRDSGIDAASGKRTPSQEDSKMQTTVDNTSGTGPKSSSDSLPTSSVMRPRGRADLIKYLAQNVRPQPTPRSEYESMPQSEPSVVEHYHSDETVVVSDIVENKKVYDMKQMEEAVEIIPINKHGTKGSPINITTNYLRLNSDPNLGVYEYDVKYSPDVVYQANRSKYLYQHRSILGSAKIFDGNKLSLPHKLEKDILELQSENPNDGSIINITIIYRRKKRLGECLALYNNLFNRIMKILKFVQFGKKTFDASSPIIIPQHKLEIWPGYVTTVEEFDGGLMLCLDVSHRMLCQTTVLEHLEDLCRRDPNNFQSNALKSLTGQVVITRYNNKTYRIDDINFKLNPRSTFSTKEGDITYLDYYKTHYNISIRDVNQPLLVSRKERRINGQDKPEELLFCLMPEICHLTGLQSETRNDMRVMRELATHTRVTPNQRMYSFKKFIENINSNPDAKQVLSQWGLSIIYPTAECRGRLMDEEVISFKKAKSSVGPNADFSRAATNEECLEVIDLQNWVLIHTKRDSQCAQKFLNCFDRNARPMGITVSQPYIEVLQDDRTESYVRALRKLITNNTQIVVIIFPTARDDRYAAVKKICCAEMPVPSQVINANTLRNDAKNRSIVQKIALQMNCKMGGALWSINIPFENVMICGIDTYHTGLNTGNAVSAFVASQDRNYTHWYSRAVIQTKKEEFLHGLCFSFNLALKEYKKKNGRYPDRIIIFRDGVSDGQLPVCVQYEIPQLKQTTDLLEFSPKFTFIVVQKRINTRLFSQDRSGEMVNPRPGTILDRVITKCNLYDFYLVSQNVRQGTVSPTHYIVVTDEAEFSADILQKLSYKLCFLYYNWPGSLRVPACCQYAHKLAYLVGNSMKRQPSELLNDRLYYL